MVITGANGIDDRFTAAPFGHPCSTLLRELDREWAEQGVPASYQVTPDERVVIERFYTGLEEHRLDLSAENGCEGFCDYALCYLELLLDPETIGNSSGIEKTASAGISLWSQMSDTQRTALWREAAELHALVKPLSFGDHAEN